MTNNILESIVSRIKTSKVLLWILLTLLTLLTMVGPALAEGATGSSV